MKPTFSEAIKLLDATFYNLAYHQERIDRTQDTLGRNRIDLKKHLQSIPDSARKGLFKCRIVYSDRIESVEYIPYSLPTINKVAIVIDDDISYDFKSTDRSRLNELRNEAKSDEIIIVKNGLITDGFATNLVFEAEDGTLYTPKSYLLSGTKRQSLIDVGRIEERQISIEDLRYYTRIHFINAMIDLEDNMSIEIDDLVK
ncbi:aminotransferase class IV [Dysgonomonas massiliensis]|uniref:aminotransferase class IV n=1 Tax=Dysgonomonas massiliensis TaxID=2040292 RepID=UPI000C784CE4|nr:aminotransferase class IV [Dysgonomonas massiliensis]